MVNTSFGKKIREFRLGAGMTQEEVSLKSGLAFRFYQDLEAERKQPTILTVYKICRTFDRLPGDFLNEAFQTWLKFNESEHSERL